MSISTEQTPFELHRLGIIMEPEPGNPSEAWGVLNPASARKDGELYLFPRLVAEGNFSRIGIARVNVDSGGRPAGVTRLGYALEPEAPYEKAEHGHGGVEDARVTFVEPLGCWVMAYTAVSHLGPRIALAVSDDLFRWERLGLLDYSLTCSVDFNMYGNKDGMLFPDAVLDPYGRPALAVLHRPTYLLHRPDGTVMLEVPCDVEDERESIWIAYISLEEARADIRALVRAYDNELVATPQERWESLKIGGGTPPIRIPQGWLTFYHGVSGVISSDPSIPKDVHYAAGALVLDARRPTRTVYRSPQPVMTAELPEEQHGIVPNVVFPTAVDLRENGHLDVYYGAADIRIGVAETTIPGQF